MCSLLPLEARMKMHISCTPVLSHHYIIIIHYYYYVHL